MSEYHYRSHMNKKIIITLLTSIIGLSSIMTADGAVTETKQVNGIVLQKIRVPKTHYEVGMEIAEYPPNTVKGSHMHSGVTLVYVLEGEIVLKMAGQPTKTFKAGESFPYPAYAVHETKSGPNGAKVLATWVGEKGKPISLPAPSNSYAISNKKIDDLAHAFMKENKVEGMSIAVINKDKTLIFNYGFANKLKNIPTTSNTIYTIASFTKTFTATLAAIASVDEKLNLDDPFIKYYPELKNENNLNNITTSELLAHVSSFPFDFQSRPTTYPALVNSLNQFRPQRTPGSEYSYSNAGIGTVGYVLQNVYAKHYQDILADKILKPLNMNSTYLHVPIEKEKYIAVGHDQNNKIVPYSKNIEVWFAAASLKSTISDMAKYLNAHINYSSINDKNLSKAISLVHENKYCFVDKISCEQLAWQAHVISQLKKSTGDSYFINYDKDGNPLFDTKKIIENKAFADNKIFIEKTASGYGMSSYMVYIPDQKTGVVILLNKSVGDERIKLGRDILKR